VTAGIVASKAGAAAGLRGVRRAAVISDLHLSPDDGAGIDTFTAFARKLPGRVDELLILGDLFEAYVGSKHLRIPQYQSIVRALDALVANGVAVTCLKGNRDFLLDDGFTRATGARVAGDEDAFESGGRRILCVHGDLFCVRDVRYQAMRKKLRSPLVAGASRILPLSVLLRIAGKLRKTSIAETKAKTKGEMGIVDEEVAKRMQENVDVIVCGHVHDPRRAAIGKGELVVLPAWPAEPGTLWITDGILRFDETQG
jgi:UDP-2,3-diacylglucosamine hydrolase